MTGAHQAYQWVDDETVIEQLFAPQRPVASGRNPIDGTNDNHAEPAFDRQLASAVSDLLEDLKIMKRARFTAAQRLYKKHEAGQFTFAISGVYGFLIPLFTLQFGTELTALTANLISFTAATSGAISFVVALLYQNQQFDRRADRFHVCGRLLNDLRRTIKATPARNQQELLAFYQRYDRILAECENHDSIDYELARSPGRWQRLRATFETYAVCAFVWFVPPLTGIFVWALLTTN